MRRRRLGLSPCLLAALAPRLRREGRSTPVACLEGADAYLDALARRARGSQARGETPISECLAENQQAGDLAKVGEAMVEAATKLNAEARAEPGGDANLQLGYLIGAAERGAEETEGIHADLIRRLTVAARFAPGRPAAPASLPRSAYERGFDAGPPAAERPAC